MDAATVLLFSTTRVLHVLTAVVLVGGSFFLRFVLLPVASRELSAADHERLRQHLMEKWKRWVHAGIGLFLLTGFINYGRIIATHAHRGDGLYHALLGTKILVALVIFFIMSVLVGRSPRFANWRQAAPKWIAVNLVLAVVVIAISGFLKVRGDAQRATVTEPSAGIARP